MPQWSEQTLASFERKAKETKVAVMVTGSIEAHGDHLPLGCDLILPTFLAERIAQKTKALVLPPIPFGESWPMDVFKGTVSLRAGTLLMVYHDVMKAVFRHGFRFILALNGHGLNTPLLRQAAEEATEGTDGTVIIVDWWSDLAKSVRAQVLESPEGHAGEDETSEVLAVRPDLVDMKVAKGARVRTAFRVVSASHREELLPRGVYGEPEGATAEKGKAIMKKAEEELLLLVEQLEQGKLPITEK
ncbi:MAG: creatininase family protein [Promethearchaeota archaeon]